MLRWAIAKWLRSLASLNEAKTAAVWQDVKHTREYRKEQKQKRKAGLALASKDPPAPPSRSVDSDTLAPDLEKTLKGVAEDFAEMIKQYPPPVITSPVPQPSEDPKPAPEAPASPPAA